MLLFKTKMDLITSKKQPCNENIDASNTKTMESRK